MGDEIWVKVLGIDDKGRVKLSRKAAMEDRDKEMEKDSQSDAESPEASSEASPESED